MREPPSSSREAGNLQKNVIRKRGLIHLSASWLQLLYDRTKRRSNADHPTDYYFSLAEDALERRRT